MSDLIEREAAFDALKKHIIKLPKYIMDDCDTNWNYAINCCYWEIEDLPSAQPERKKGKWIQNDNGTYSCSLCHSWIPEEQYYYAQFCLYCGTDMRGKTIGKVD